MAAISKQQLEDASVDAQAMSDVVNGGPTQTVNTRLGGAVDTVAKAIQTIKAFNYRGAWVTATAYAIKDVVTNGGIAYVAPAAFVSSGSFATDLAAGNWVVHQGATLEQLIAGTGATLITFTPGGTGAVARTVAFKLLEFNTNSDRGAVNDGATNDKAANDLALSHSINGTLAQTLEIMGVSKVTSSVILDRAVGPTFTGTSGELIIGARGMGAGFTVSTAVTIFDSTLTTLGTNANSERIRFRDLRLYSSDKTLAAYVLSKQFLRTKFDQVAFDAIKAVNADTYMQQIEFNGCDVRRWQGYFFTSHNNGQTGYGYGLRVNRCWIEAGDSGFHVDAIIGGDLSSNTYEGCTGPFLTSIASTALLISNNYHEGYTGYQYQVADQQLFGGQGHGAAFISNCLQAGAVGVPAILLGPTTGAGLANYSNDIIYDTTYVQKKLGYFLSIGDFAVGEKFTTDGLFEVTADGVQKLSQGTPTSPIIAHAGGGMASATQLVQYGSVFYVSAVNDHDSCAFPVSDDISSPEGGYTKRFTIVNVGNKIVDMYHSQIDRGNFGGGTPLTMYPLAVGTFMDIQGVTRGLYFVK
jgi:hypothetical protein